MKGLVSLIACILLAGGTVVSLATAAREEADVYFNAGTEKYLQGNFTESIENLEKAQALTPQNGKIREFMVKILLEAATQNHLNRNYRQAFVYLQKARSIAPENPKVQEMYQLTRGLLTPSEEKVLPKEKPKSAAQPAVAPSTVPVAQAAVPKAERAAPAPRKPPAAVVQVKVPPAPRANDTAMRQVPAGGQGTGFWLAVAWSAASTVLLVVVAGMLLAQSRRLRESQANIESQAKDIARLFEEKSRFLTELEKTKESLRYEHQLAENAQKELKEIRVKEEERYRQEMDYRTRQEQMRQAVGSMLQRDEERFISCVNDSTRKETATAGAIEAARERIALMAQNLHEYAPGAAIDFLNKMAKDQNPLVRSNIILALVRIASTETLGILLELAADADERVKREVLKNGKLVQQKAEAGMLSVDPAILDRIEVLLEKEKTRGEWIF